MSLFSKMIYRRLFLGVFLLSCRFYFCQLWKSWYDAKVGIMKRMYPLLAASMHQAWAAPRPIKIGVSHESIRRGAPLRCDNDLLELVSPNM